MRTWNETCGGIGSAGMVSAYLRDRTRGQPCGPLAPPAPRDHHRRGLGGDRPRPVSPLGARRARIPESEPRDPSKRLVGSELAESLGSRRGGVRRAASPPTKNLAHNMSQQGIRATVCRRVVETCPCVQRSGISCPDSGCASTSARARPRSPLRLRALPESVRRRAAGPDSAPLPFPDRRGVSWLAAEGGPAQTACFQVRSVLMDSVSKSYKRS